MKTTEYVIELEVINPLMRVIEGVLGYTDMYIDISSKRDCEWSNDIHWYTIHYTNDTDLITLGRHIESVKRNIMRQKVIESNKRSF